MLFLKFAPRVNQYPARKRAPVVILPDNFMKGFSLLEVLISLLIFTVGFLGLASLQHVALSATYDATLQNSAVNLADSLLTRVRVEGASVDLASWQQEISEQLPNASGQLVKQGEAYQIRLQWQESSQSQSPMQHYKIGFRHHD